MIVLSYFLLFICMISCSASVLSFLYGVYVPEDKTNSFHTTYLTKHTIRLALHLALLLLLFCFSLTFSVVSHETAMTIYNVSAGCGVIFIGILMVRIIQIGFQYVTAQ